MEVEQLLFEKEEQKKVRTRYNVVPRPYQHDALDKCFEIFDSDIRGALLRMFTGAGKTICAAMIADRWLQLGERRKVMVVSYEIQLVWQFAQEIEDVLGIKPGVEMEEEEIPPGKIPPIVVASRQTLATQQPASIEQREFLRSLGLSETDIGLCTFRFAERIVRAAKRGQDAHFLRDALGDFHANYRIDRELGAVSRLHKFDWRDDWLVAYDEGHKFVMKLKTTGNLVNWFDRNPRSRRIGLTATPKRFDNVSIGDKMFPGIAIDYPLWRREGRCAVADGYAVPYLQKYVRVESIDFEEIKQLAGTNQKKWDAEVAKRLETELATFCEPTLELVEDRKTLIFNPSVAMARQVADYINARCKCRCVCGRAQWHPRPRVGDGAKCRWCSHYLTNDNILETPEQQAFALWGEIPATRRREVYTAHQRGDFQFLSVCSLAKEGYNDPGISCVAIFRPVSRAASSLAEQMKGRGCRPLRGLIEGVESAEERLKLIAESDAPNCLIIDLTGITGLGDCATTVQIYAEGEEDEVVARAEQLTQGGVEDIGEAISKAREDVAAERQKAAEEHKRREEEAREMAKQRALARARANYTVHDVGHGGPRTGHHDTDLATDKQVNYIRFLGMELVGWEPSLRQAGRMIDQLLKGVSRKEVAYMNGLANEFWVPATPSRKQLWALDSAGVTLTGKQIAEMTPAAASKLIDRHKNGGVESAADVVTRIDMAQSPAELDKIKKDIRPLWGRYSESDKAKIVAAGKARREVVKNEF